MQVSELVSTRFILSLRRQAEARAEHERRWALLDIDMVRKQGSPMDTVRSMADEDMHMLVFHNQREA